MTTPSTEPTMRERRLAMTGCTFTNGPTIPVYAESNNSADKTETPLCPDAGKDWHENNVAGGFSSCKLSHMGVRESTTERSNCYCNGTMLPHPRGFVCAESRPSPSSDEEIERRSRFVQDAADIKRGTK